jgi:hypothetical protein
MMAARRTAVPQPVSAEVARQTRTPTPPFFPGPLPHRLWHWSLGNTVPTRKRQGEFESHRGQRRAHLGTASSA